MSPLDRERGPDNESVLSQLERILGSTDFDTSERSREFLRFVVEATLNGHGEEVTQHRIATSVFGRREDFDPTTDPIVRMQAGRVRRSLEHYYLSAGHRDPIVIEIPKGGYVPRFHRGEHSEPRPTLLIKPLSREPRDDFVAQGLASDLAIELDRYRHFHVIYSETTEAEEKRASVPASFVVEGALRSLDDTFKISLRLLDVSTGQQLWGQQYRHNVTDPGLDRFLDELAQSIAATLADERGVLPRHLSKEIAVRRQTRESTTYEAILRYYHFEITPTLDGFFHALTGLRQAVELEPDYGLAWAHLARLYATNYALEFVDEETPIETAQSYAETGVRLEPLDQRIRLTNAFVHLIKSDVDKGRREVDYAIELNPDSLFFLDAVGYLLTLLGDWERGPELSRRAIHMNPCHRDIVHAGLWLDALRREDYPTALRQADAFMQPGHVWQPLMRAVALAYLDRLEEASPYIEQILALKPAFRDRGRWLIERYVKFHDLVETIVHGLATSGLKID